MSSKLKKKIKSLVKSINSKISLNKNLSIKNNENKKINGMIEIMNNYLNEDVKKKKKCG